MTERKRQITKILLKTRSIDISKYDETFLLKSIQKRITETHCSTFEDYYKLLEEDYTETNNFLNSLNISYSEFFRNSLTFCILERIILPSLIIKKRDAKYKEIRIWSAACALGQEPYSLAMLFEEYFGCGLDGIHYRIFATDQSSDQIDKACKGEFNLESMSHLSLKRIKHWFTKQGDSYSINNELKKQIDFTVFDLFNEELSTPAPSIFGDFDLVICANLLFYYKEEYRKIILEKTGNSLAIGGYLITGETERDILISNNYTEVFPQSAIFQKTNMAL